jgi:hypothetical protein
MADDFMPDKVIPGLLAGDQLFGLILRRLREPHSLAGKWCAAARA